MTSPVPSDITQILSRARQGERGAADRVFSAVYDELRRIAHIQLQRAPHERTLNTTAVVHEAYLNLMRGTSVEWEDRGHFFAVAATAMRNILVSFARRRLAQKRGAGASLAQLDEAEGAVSIHAEEVLDLHDALSRLSDVDERLARVVDLRFFAGLSIEETAHALGVTDRTVKRDWRVARAFLYNEIVGTPPS